MARSRQHWLVKQNPASFPIDQLEKEGPTAWVEVRNYEARNNMQEMREGDLVLYYHSSANPSGVAGIAKVVEEAYADPTQFDEDSPYYDEDSDPDDPTWELVDIEHVETFPHLVPLSEIKGDGRLGDMVLVRRSRLSVQPVREKEFEIICEMGRDL